MMRTARGYDGSPLDVLAVRIVLGLALRPSRRARAASSVVGHVWNLRSGAARRALARAGLAWGARPDDGRARAPRARRARNLARARDRARGAAARDRRPGA